MRRRLLVFERQPQQRLFHPSTRRTTKVLHRQHHHFTLFDHKEYPVRELLQAYHTDWLMHEAVFPWELCALVYRVKDSKDETDTDASALVLEVVRDESNVRLGFREYALRERHPYFARSRALTSSADSVREGSAL